MSQCHDSYEPMGVGPVAVVRVGGARAGTQCHDGYQAGGPPSPVLARSRGALATTPRERAQVLRVIGRVDWVAQRRIEDILSTEADRDVIVDLSCADPDPAGRRLLVAFVARARQRGRRVVVVAPDPLVYHQALGGGLSRLVHVAVSRPDAVRWLARHRPRCRPR